MIRSLVGVTLAVLFATPALADDLKVGYVDMQKVYDTSNEFQRAKKRVEAKRDEIQKKIDESEKRLQAFMEDTQKQLSLMSEAARLQKKDEYVKIMSEYRDQAMKSQKDIMDFSNKVLGPIQGKIQDVINQIGLSEGFTLILLKDATLYAMPHLDITAKVVKRLNGQ